MEKDRIEELKKGIDEPLQELKKSRKRLQIITCINFAFGVLLLILFITSFTEFSIFSVLHFSLKFMFLGISAINFFTVYKTVPIIKQSKNVILDAEKICTDLVKMIGEIKE